MSNTFVRIGGLLAVLAVGAWFKFFFEPEYGLNRAPIDTIEFTQPVSYKSHNVDPATVYQNKHGIEQSRWTAPSSSWRNNEKRAAAELLRGSRSHFLILPVAGDENAFGPSERMLITRMLTDQISQLDGYTVADSDLVDQYLGVHRSVAADEDISALTALINTATVIKTVAKHDRSGSWSLSVSTGDGSGNQYAETATWDNLRYSDESPAIVAFEDIVSEVVEYATAKKTNRVKGRSDFAEDEFQFPADFDDLREQAGRSALHSAAYLQLLGMLHPSGSYDEARYRLFERSLIELQKVSPDEPMYAYFKARAYAYLERRPAAVALIREPKNDPERALLAALNGNLGELRKHTDSLGISALGFMAARDLLTVEYDYSWEDESPYLDVYVESNPKWAPFIYRSLTDRKTWANFTAAVPIVGLERLVPSSITSLEDHLASQVATGDDADELELTRLLFRHIESFDTETRKAWLDARPSMSSISELDILDLSRSIAVANHIRQITVNLKKRASPPAAMREISRFESIYAGHPEVTLLKAKAMAATADESSGSEQANLNRTSAELFLNGYVWTRHVTKNAVSVAKSFGPYIESAKGRGTRVESNRIRFPGDYSRRNYEWPLVQAWHSLFSSAQSGDTKAYDACVDYTWTLFWCAKKSIEYRDGTSFANGQNAEQMLAAYAGRFVDSPTRVEYEIQLGRVADDPDREFRLLEEQIATGSARWDVYYALGRLHKRLGDYQAAYDVWMSYPDFQDPSMWNTLEIGGNAGLAGSMLFWVGQHELALPLLEIGSSNNSGSGATMSSLARVALIQGDLAGAAEWSAERVRRYKSAYGARDLIEILHATGESELAWSVFEQVHPEMQSSQLWSGALVGHRLEATTTPEIATWINEKDNRKNALVDYTADRWQIDLPQRYLLLAGTMDRVPPTDFSGLVAKAYTRRPHHYEHAPRRGSDAIDLIRPSFVRTPTGRRVSPDPNLPTPPDLRRVASGDKVPPRLTLVAPAIAAFLRDDFERAFEQFNEAAYFYKLEEYLPYYAYSAAIVGKATHLPDALEAREPALRESRQKDGLKSSVMGLRFDEDTANAVLAAFDGRHDAAIQYLNLALNDRPYINDRAIYPMYELVDIAERLFAKTDQSAYRDFALDLSRRHTVILPMHSWAYFVVATHSESKFERVQSAASGLALDPLSQRGSLLPKQLIEDAKRALEESGPPYLKRTAEVVSEGV